MELLDTVVYWFTRGGAVMYLLLIASILAVAIVIERLKYYKVHLEGLEAYRERTIGEIASGNPLELETRERTASSALSHLTAAALGATRQGKSVELALTAAAQMETARLKQGLPILACLVTLSPLLGLMGTVLGMIQSFSVFNVQTGAPMAITGGVGEALVATVTGLGVAVAALIGHAYLGFRLDKSVTDMEAWGTELEGLLTPGGEPKKSEVRAPQVQGKAAQAL